MSAVFPLIQEHLILTRLSAINAREVLQNMSDVLVQHGHVKDGFAQAVIRREEDQPTGLPTASVGIAIPHADPDYVLHPAICVGFPERPVTFRMMGEETETVEAGVIFMLAINRSEQQLALFQNLMDFIQDEDLMSRLMKLNTRKDIADMLSEYLHA